MSASLMLGPTIALVAPPHRVEAGEGTVGEVATKRLDARAHAALATATRDALDAATGHPGDLRLQRRAAAMVRETAHDETARSAVPDLKERAGHLLARLTAASPCPGLADAGATWLALEESSRAGDAYVAAAGQCESVDAALAAVRPLRVADRCEDAIAVLRAAWPHVRDSEAIAVLDGVNECSDAITLRRNLAFAPPDVVADYFTVLEDRRIQAVEDRRRAEAAAQEEAARERAASARFSCESECSAAVSSCSSSCRGDSSCDQRCSSVGHVCRSGCGGY